MSRVDRARGGVTGPRIGRLALAAGTYDFTAVADDGVRLWVDGALLIDEWRESPGQRYTAERYLEQGEHSIVVEYFQRFAFARVSLTWEREDRFPAWKGDLFSGALKFGQVRRLRLDGTRRDGRQHAFGTERQRGEVEVLPRCRILAERHVVGHRRSQNSQVVHRPNGAGPTFQKAR